MDTSEFEFERRQVSMENLRDLIYHEVATHYPGQGRFDVNLESIPLFVFIFYMLDLL